METNKNYPTDLSEREWTKLEKLLPNSRMGRPRKYSHRVMLNALFYLLRSGCAWRLLPKEMPPWQAVYAYFRKLEREGHWMRINDALRAMMRARLKRESEASTLVVDSQSVKTTEKGGRGAMTGVNASKDVNVTSLSTR
jgi:putative transposase